MVSRPLMFLKWYFLEEPIGIIQSYSRYACALLDIVPFGFLLRTILSPWKNIVERTPRHGLNIPLIFEAFCLALLARGVGLVVRLLTIAMGIALHALLLAMIVTYLVIWLAFPFASVFGVGFIFA